MENIQHTEKGEFNLGAKIRQLRMEKGMKIVDLASLTNLTSSMISQVERSIISPSVETLKKVGAALDVPVSYFFELPEEAPEQTPASDIEQHINSPVVRKKDRKVLSPNSGITYYLLNPSLMGPIEFIYNIYEPGSRTGDGLYTHPGNECGLVLEGELVVQIEEDVHKLKKGDSITFDSSKPHALRNESSKRCVCVWANTPPWF
ncbi:MAG: cupin domain-containing protein [Christensenellaceae bacterium]